MFILDRKVFNRLITIFLFLLVFSCLFPDTHASSLSESIKQLDFGQVSSSVEIKTALEHLSKSVTEAIMGNTFTFEFQEMALKKTGECIGKLMDLREQSAQETDAFRQNGKDIFMMNREILKQILSSNKKIISDTQEKRLDRMEDPLTFFKSSEWQQPQHLIALSSYWLGWNGYYSSLLFLETDPMRKILLEEAIEGFSRAFLDSREDAMIINSLFGRGLCYRQMKDYSSALKDFKSVKETLHKEDPLYWKCRYEETFIRYQMGDLGAALHNLDAMEKEWTEDKPPNKQKADLKILRANILVARLEKQEKSDKKGEEPDELFQRTLTELKELSKGDPGPAEVFYRYAQEHAGRLENRSYAELGPIAAIAIGDWFFGQSKYDKALSFYQTLYADSPSILKDRIDSLWFRIAYIYCKKEAWNEAIPYLEKFYDRFPESVLMKQAITLYYVAASNQYKKNAREGDYKTFIDSLQAYLSRCTTCPGQSDAHFHLGKHYHKTGKMEQALNEYLQVGRDSTYYGLAKYHVLNSQVDQLESFKKRGQNKSKTAAEIYRSGVRLIEEVQEARLKNDESDTRNNIEPYMMILQARFFLFGPDDACKKGLERLEGFESRYPGEKSLFIEAARLRMESYLRLRMVKEAEREVDRFVKAVTIDSEQYANLLDLANRYDEEAKLFQKSGEKGTASRYATASLMIYKKLYALSEGVSSRQQLRKSIQFKMAQIYMDEDKLLNAIELYQEIIKKDPLSVEAMHDLGLLYEKTGQWQEALHIWRRLSEGVKAGTDDWLESRYRMAHAFKKVGAKDKACTILTMTMTVHPNLGSDQLRKKYLDLKSEMCNERR